MTMTSSPIRSALLFTSTYLFPLIGFPLVAYVAVASNVSAKALKSLGQGRIKGKRFVVTLVK